MKTSAAKKAPVAPDFRPGSVTLRIKRGNTYVLVPRAAVRSVTAIAQIVPLPRAQPWVLGMVIHDGRPVPLIDAAVCAGGHAELPKAGVLIGSPDSNGVALIASDEAGRFLSIPAAAYVDLSKGWVSRVHGCPGNTWWLDAERLNAELNSSSSHGSHSNRRG